LLLLSPGILAIAVTNVYGNYFSAIGKLKILIIKSAVGVVFTVILSVILIPRLQITGACIVNAVSYIVSSTILVIAFCRHKAIS
jgi:O-antigen/teichoic acid export membrane protein